MPFCEVSKYQKGREAMPAENGGGGSSGMRIYYRRYGRGVTKVLLIIGFAGTHQGWGPQVKGLTGTDQPTDEEAQLENGAAGAGAQRPEEEEEEEGGEEEQGIEVCCFDNRGMGRSSVPTKKTEYTTSIMAKDALALLDHLGWRKAHVFGHSMGAMIACKLAAIAPDRISSLALLNVTGGGFQCFPKIDRQMLSLAIRFLRAKTPEERAMVDLDTHYTKEYLDEPIGSVTRREILYCEYVKGISSAGMQSSHGFEGQVNACWTHSMSSKELDIIRTSGFPVLVIHGRNDVIAQVAHARTLAKKLHPAAKMIELHGAHLVSHERPVEVNSALIRLIQASHSQFSPRWSAVFVDETAALVLSEEEVEVNCLPTTYDILSKFQLSVLYIFGVFVMGFDHARKAVKMLKPVRVSAGIS